MSRGRCTTCTVCTPRGCLDLAQGKATSQFLGAARKSHRWLRTPQGVFMAALPGFILGYSLVADGPIQSAPSIYASTLGFSAASYVVVAAVILAARIDFRYALPLVAALAGGLYYWFAGPAIARELAVAGWVAPVVQAVGIALVALWLLVAVRRGTSGDQHAGAVVVP